MLTATDGASGETALHLACVEGYAGCVKALLDEVRRNRPRPGGVIIQEWYGFVGSVFLEQVAVGGGRATNGGTGRLCNDPMIVCTAARIFGGKFGDWLLHQVGSSN